MRILIYGAGAIGGYIGGILAADGKDVTLVARGAQHAALAKDGLRLEGPKSGRPEPIRVNVCRPGEEKPPYDLIIVGLKSQQIAAVAPRLAELLAKDGALLMPQNGLPWWYFDRLESPLKGTRLATLDPEGVLAKHLPLDTIVGAVIYKPVTVVAPGHLKMVDAPTDHLDIGEVDDRRSPRADAIAAMLTAAGLRTDVVPDIRKAKWAKLLINMVWNPLCSITQSAQGHVADHPRSERLVTGVMREGLAIAAAVGVKLDIDPVRMFANAKGKYDQQPSMLQDVRAGRSLELDSIVNAVLEMGQLTKVPAPNLEVVAAVAGILSQRIADDGVAFRPVKAG
ncbi:MAG: ketopantoate reductase family protein [Burkholderiales bacterium]